MTISALNTTILLRKTEIYFFHPNFCDRWPSPTLNSFWKLGSNYAGEKIKNRTIQWQRWETSFFKGLSGIRTFWRFLAFFRAFLSIQAIFEKFSMTRVGREKFLMVFYNEKLGSKFAYKAKRTKPGVRYRQPPCIYLLSLDNSRREINVYQSWLKPTVWLASLVLSLSAQQSELRSVFSKRV